MRTSRFLIFLLGIFGFTNCMNDGDELQWTRHAHIVKIISQLSENNTVACTGTIISQSYILTSAKCFDGITKEDLNAVVLLPRPGGATTNRKVIEVSIDGDSAVLTIKKRPYKELCPLSPIPPRVQKLPISLSLTESSWKVLDWDNLMNIPCRVIGFRTVRVNEYHDKHIMLQTSVNVTSEDMLHADVVEGRGACWDDIGLPLECELKSNSWVQVGFLHSLVTVENENDSEQNDDSCANVSRMRFEKLDESIGNLLNSLNVKEIISIHSTCFNNE